ncbi:MAG: hypothetical protein IPK07_34645 [Deltaproteobacteria bacterium]|nr:hypothetical protein [Deltaproteobacteria bacterium]
MRSRTTRGCGAATIHGEEPRVRGDARARERGPSPRASRAPAAQRAAGQPTIPSTIGEEKAFNPFLRVTSPELIATLVAKDPAQATDPVSVFAAVRKLKDNF